MARDLARRVSERNQPNGSGTEVAEQQPQTLAQQIRSMEQQFQVAMPRGAEAAQLIRDALTALRTNPKLNECDATSVLGALMTCAQLGLRPGVLGHAWVLPFWDNRSRRHKAQLVIGYQGYRELAQRSGQIATVIARPVHEFDEFDIDYGLADNLVHKPKLRGQRGEITGYYAIVKYTSGGYAFWYMSHEEVETWRDLYAMAKDRHGRIVGPWRDDFDAMACKTVFLRLAKWMPKSTELATAIETDGTVRVDLSADNGAILHGERPAAAIDGEVVDGSEASTAEAEESPTEQQPEQAPDPTEENWQTLVDAEQQEAARQSAGESGAQKGGAR